MENKTITSNISFCGKIVKNITSETVKEQILDKLLNNYNISISQRDCAILKPNYCTNLKKNDHVISTKSSGNPYYLFMTKYNNVNTCFYIDKKIKEGFNLPRILISKQRFEDSIFNDTLIEGELIRTNNQNWLFLLSNLYVYKGNLIDSNMIEKFDILYSLLSNDYQIDYELDPCRFEVKKIFNFNQFSEMIDNFIPNLPYKVRGLIFYPINKKYNNLLYLFPNKNNVKKVEKVEKVTKVDNKITIGINYIPNTNDIISKEDIISINKSINENIAEKLRINFKIVSTDAPDIFNLHLLHNEKYILYGIANVQTLKCSKFIKKIFKNQSDDIFVECKYSTKFDKWEPINLSKDKKSNTFTELKKSISI